MLAKSTIKDFNESMNSSKTKNTKLNDSLGSETHNSKLNQNNTHKTDD